MYCKESCIGESPTSSEKAKGVPAKPDAPNLLYGKEMELTAGTLEGTVGKGFSKFGEGIEQYVDADRRFNSVARLVFGHTGRHMQSNFINGLLKGLVRVYVGRIVYGRKAEAEELEEFLAIALQIRNHFQVFGRYGFPKG